MIHLEENLCILTAQFCVYRLVTPKLTAVRENKIQNNGKRLSGEKKKYRLNLSHRTSTTLGLT